MKRTAIVILNWNGAKMLEKFMPMVLEFSRHEADVYVADNASTDNSIELLKNKFPEVKIIQLKQNWGFAEGYNKALEKLEAEYFVLMNSDVEVVQNWLTPLVLFMDMHQDAAACQPKLMSEYNKETFEYAGACGGFIDKYGYPFCRGRIFDTIEKDHGQYDNVEEILWATGACLMIRSKDYREAGGLDTKFFAHCEEIDLCWRLRLMGRKVCCVPNSHVYHVGGGTLPKENPMKTYLNFRNNLTMLYKNLSSGELHRIMLMRWFLDYIAAFKMLLLEKKVNEFKAVFRARKDFHHWKKDFKATRKNIQANKKVDNIPERKNYSILWQYYIKGRKTFSEIENGRH
ncbi:MAG: glycosyltransferase family 2 protein [Prevotella sp.]|nr:glycosyltransferase family 2 protein [Prevotella sp.]